MFETSLVASQPRRGRPRHRQLLPVAALAHGVLVGVCCSPPPGASRLCPSRTSPPRRRSWCSARHRRSATPGRARPPRPPATAAGRRRRSAPVQPTTLPAETPAAPEVAEEALVEVGDAAAGEESGDAGEGSILGVPDGVGDHPVGDIGGTGVGDRPIHLHRGMTPPEVIRRVIPAYTEPARRARLEGTVILEAIIDTEGRVTACACCARCRWGSSRARSRRCGSGGSGRRGSTASPGTSTSRYREIRAAVGA